MAKYQIIEVHSVAATAEPDAYNVDVTYSLFGETDRAMFMSRPDDPYGLGPGMRQWLTDHEGEYSVEPYEP